MLKTSAEMNKMKSRKEEKKQQSKSWFLKVNKTDITFSKIKKMREDLKCKIRNETLQLMPQKKKG